MNNIHLGVKVGILVSAMTLLTGCSFLSPDMSTTESMKTTDPAVAEEPALPPADDLSAVEADFDRTIEIMNQTDLSLDE